MKNSVSFVKLGVMSEHYKFRRVFMNDHYVIDGNIKLKTAEDIEIFISGFELAIKLRAK